VITLRASTQSEFAHGFLEQAVGDLWEPWMRQADRLLEDEELLSIVYAALLRRHPKSRTRGRPGFPAEIVLRMLLLKHIRNWSFRVLGREVRPNLLYREFTRVYAGKVPDAETLGRQAVSLGPEVVERIQKRVVELAGRTMWCRAAGCEWIRPSSKPTSITRPTGACWAMGCVS